MKQQSWGYAHKPQISGIPGKLGWVILLPHVALTWVIQCYSTGHWAGLEGPRGLHPHTSTLGHGDGWMAGRSWALLPCSLKAAPKQSLPWGGQNSYVAAPGSKKPRQKLSVLLKAGPEQTYCHFHRSPLSKQSQIQSVGR